MKYAVICPVPLLDKYIGVSDYHMALTHLVKPHNLYTAYYNFRAERGDYVILDNSLIELGTSVNIETILTAAELVKASEIILPDVFRNSELTLQCVDDALKKYSKDLRKYKLMAVAQGENHEEWIACHNTLASYKEIDVIGIPKVASTFSGMYPANSMMGRVELCKRLQEQFDANGFTCKEYHLLGVWNNPYPEIPYIAMHNPWIRGVDTVLPVAMGLKGILFNDEGMPFDRPKEHFDFYQELDRYPDIVERNIFKMLKWVNAA